MPAKRDTTKNDSGLLSNSWTSGIARVDATRVNIAGRGRQRGKRHSYYS